MGILWLMGGIRLCIYIYIYGTPPPVKPTFLVYLVAFATTIRQNVTQSLCILAMDGYWESVLGVCVWGFLLCASNKTGNHKLKH